jgi:hypothetical protein
MISKQQTMKQEYNLQSKLHKRRQSQAGSPSKADIANKLAPVLARVPSVPKMQRVVICLSWGVV